MLQALPKVLPINELKNTARITQTCKESNVPIIVTKNGYGEMVLMSLELYEQTMAEVQAAMMINESIDQIDSGATPMEGAAFFSAMRKRYGK